MLQIKMPEPAANGRDRMTDEFDWEDLLELIEDRRVIPVIGDQLLQIPLPSGPVPLYRIVAERLVEKLRLPRSALPERLTLNEVVCKHLDAGGDVDEVYRKIRPILQDVLPSPPEELLQLARISQFDLFVSLTFDSLLADAIDQVRFGGQASTLRLVYRPTGKDDGEGGDDLPTGWKKSPKTAVFQMFGKVSASPGYVVSDEDLLEFVHSLQVQDRRPQQLFDEIGTRHLLFIGCRFSDWLARLFLRISRNKRLSDQRPGGEMLVDSDIAEESGLAVFLRHFSAKTELLPMSADRFVPELVRRWEARHPPRPPEPLIPSSMQVAELPVEMEEGAVFISYASEDLPAAQALLDALVQAKLDAWMDKHELQPGENWDRKIRRNIRSCSLFIPLISSNTERRLEGYFRREWHEAAERACQIAEGVPFILPVIIDATSMTAETSVPEKFHAVQGARLPGGRVTPGFIAHLQDQVRDYWRRQRR